MYTEVHDCRDRVLQQSRKFISEAYIWLTLFCLLLQVIGIPLAYATSHASLKPDALKLHVLKTELQPLSGQEMTQAVTAIKNSSRYSKDLVFSYVTLKENPKENNAWISLLAKNSVQKQDRVAIAVLYDHKNNQLFEVEVKLPATTHDNTSISTWNLIKDVQPMGTDYDYSTAEKLVKNSLEWRAALAKRGFMDIEKIYFDTWIGEASNNPAYQNHRLLRAIPFLLTSDGNNYGHPIEGLGAIIDLTSNTVNVLDTNQVEIAKQSSAYDAKKIGKLRPPIHLVQPKQAGNNIQMNGNEITWQNWRFKVSVDPRDGVVLHQIRYFDQGKWRPILYRVSLDEMFIPYGDPDPQWSWRHAFDVSEYGTGIWLRPLTKGVDVPENVILFNQRNTGDQGEQKLIQDTVGIYEEYGGVAWRHFDFISETNHARRAQNLVVTSSVAMGNYDYLMSYIFKQDGSIEVVVGLTGIMMSKGTDANHPSDFGHLVTEGVNAVHHQHFFNFRLDFDVDGPNNSVFEANTHALPLGPQNPKGNAFVHQLSPLKSEMGAQRDVNLASNRFWLVTNPNIQNRLGHPVGYAIIPGSNTVPYMHPDNLARQIAGFINHNLWVTRYDAKEMNATGLYPTLANQANGLPQWATRDQNLENTDLVVWYTMGTTHIPRPEEWPVMPVNKLSFKIIPVGFFDRNPALDLPEN